MKNRFFIFFSLIIITSLSAKDPIDYVDPKIGTTKLGNTYPAVCTPFGLCKWTPQTRAGEKKGDKPYDYMDEKIQGIRWTNFFSGSAVPEYGSCTIAATTGEFAIDPSLRASRFSHDKEIFTPYYGAIFLQDYNIEIEYTATTRCGYFRFTFPKSEDAKIILQPNNFPLAPHTKADAYIQVIPERNEIVGYNPVYRYYISTGKPAGFSGFFVARFNTPIQSYKIWQDETIKAEKIAQGQPGAFVEFQTTKNQVIEVKVGCSFTSLDQARKNLDFEIPMWDFERSKTTTRLLWEKALGKILVEGTNEDKIKFYTALYHSLLLPRFFNDVDGSFPGFANSGPQQSTDFTYYEDYSMWDTYRALHPLLLLIQPERIDDMIKSLLVKAELGGWLPIFPAWNSYTTEMIGDHVISMITDAYVKGYRNFDTEKAFDYMKKNATTYPDSFDDYLDGKGRRAVLVQRRLGYIPLEHPIIEAFHQKEQVSRTMEYAYDDFCLSEFARLLGKEKEAADFRQQALNYKNVFDKTTGFVRGKTLDGYWQKPFDPGEHYPYICEATPWVYTWYVPHDVQGLINLMGGQKNFVEKLDEFFEKGFYAHDNEPSHQITYLYNWAGAAWKTQKRVREAMRDNYSIQAGGLTGNDDAGQMSAWYILSALGFYTVCPGREQYVIGSPIFSKAVIQLTPPRYAEGTTLTIIANNVSETNKYIQSMTLNGTPWNKSWFSHQDIENGGEIVFEMGATPNTRWGNEPPYSMTQD